MPCTRPAPIASSTSQLFRQDPLYLLPPPRDGSPEAAWDALTPSECRLPPSPFNLLPPSLITILLLKHGRYINSNPFPPDPLQTASATSSTLPSARSFPSSPSSTSCTASTPSAWPTTTTTTHTLPRQRHPLPGARPFPRTMISMPRTCAARTTSRTASTTCGRA